MNVLVLGGTTFVGRHIVEALLRRNHAVTIFTRGKTNTDLFPNVARLIGDRDSDVRAIEEDIRRRRAAGRSFDACIDVSCYTLAQVERSLDAMADNVGRYLFISSVGVYQPPIPEHFTEGAPVREIDDPRAPFSVEAYGGLKVVCERALEQRMGQRGVALRLGLAAGPWDFTDRVTYWCTRVQREGEIFVPAAPDAPFQCIDARDAGLAAEHALTNELAGPFNIVNTATTWRAWLDMSARSNKGNPGETFHSQYLFADDHLWVDQQAAAITAPRWAGALPMFRPAAEGWNLWTAANSRSLDAGVTYRSYQETIDAILAWRRLDPTEIKAGLTPAQERQLIDAWREHSPRARLMQVG